MGTRGCYGFEINGKKKVMYNHYDSYPEGLGHDIIYQIKDTINLDKIDLYRQRVAKIVLVDENKKPSPRLIEKYRDKSDTSVSTGSLEDWYCLLRKAQGDLTLYLRGEVKHMIDCSGAFKKPKKDEYGTWTEYAYVINFDTLQLDFYIAIEGYQQKIKSYDLLYVYNTSIESIVEDMINMCDIVYAKDIS